MCICALGRENLGPKSKAAFPAGDSAFGKVLLLECLLMWVEVYAETEHHLGEDAADKHSGYVKQFVHS